ncbi:MAG TPA: T9SS type A sorting domain-containing protein [Chryseolinea sp.]|nr:T9SS type A sorting domain-containing protein [Chryseolinea sp.]HPM30772.1 T9SS type A sorting domain-containing protein [Chryseolinea sp.]
MQIIKSTPKVILSRWVNKRFLYLLCILSFHLQLVSVDAVAQYTKLLDFGSHGGSNPYGSLISVGTDLYGMTANGGANCLGTIFKIKSDGSGHVKLFDFEGVSNGRNPNGSLFSDGTFLYGMTSQGGIHDFGTIFKIKLDGSGYSKLLDFDGLGNGSYPNGNLISDGTFLYGMTSRGGEFDAGTIFKIALDQSSFETLQEFHFSIDGINPSGSLTLSGSTLYGMTNSGGVSDFGTVFKIMPNGTAFDFTKLFDFDGVTSGSYPKGSLIVEGTTLYGMTYSGGTFNDGVIFKLESEITFSKLHDFQGSADGSEPYGDLILEGGFLYGLTSYYGNDYGTIFKIKPDGTSFENLRSLNGTTDGDAPHGSLISDGEFLYGMTSAGGHNIGTIFKIKFDGTGYNKLHDFGRTAANPIGSFISDGTFLYGMTTYGGGYWSGTIFKVLPDGNSYSTLYNFYEGNSPSGSLLFDGTFLYGMTSQGGLNNFGAIFKILPDGTGYSRIFDFDGSNGSQPYGSLISDGTFLYGMTYNGGNDVGVIFKIKPDGTGYVSLSVFDEPGAGNNPMGDLLLGGNTLYGMTRQGGINNLGTIFKLNKDGTGYATIHNFGMPGDGASPNGSLISDGTFLYGMTQAGGLGAGTIFKIKFDGTDYTNLLNFQDNGSSPYGSLLFDGSYLYGLTANGASFDEGTMFKILPDGTDHTVLVDFTETVSGKNPYGSLLHLGSSLYGMTSAGGNAKGGTVFKYELSNTCPGVATITATNTELTASTGDNYQWYYFGEVISGETNQSLVYNMLEYGVYSVDVTINGCTSTADFEYLITGQDQESMPGIQVFPNPVSENVFVAIPQTGYTFKITDLLGRVILEQPAEKGLNELNTVDLTSGLYYLAVKSHDDVIVYKIQKQ